ncbi:RND superfamily protein [Minicystis rosea]|nr:RND superfamily protein [Minicystis rosea]
MNRPAIPLLAALAITVLSVFLAMKLKIQTGFEALLPENRPSVLELHRVAAKTAGVSSLFIVLEAGPNTPKEALRKAGDKLVPEIAKVGSPWVGSVEDGVHDVVKFISPRAGLYADTEKLQKVHDDIEARFSYEVNKAAGSLLDDSEPPPPLDATSIRKTLGISEEQEQQYPDGYYQSADGKTLVVAIRSQVMGTELERGKEALRRIGEVVEKADLKSIDPGITWGMSGDLKSGNEEFRRVNEDLTDVGKLGVILITSVVFLYYLRIRTLFAMVLTIAIGVSWTFGITQVLVGHLNMATGFLFTIIAGNGINFAIIYMSRFLEARRRGAGLQDGVRIAHRETWLPTLTAGCAAAASYGSLMITEFRGFRDFGMIGSVGMVLCWTSTYLTLPCILAVMERIAPIKVKSSGPPSSLDVALGPIAKLRRITRSGIAFGKPFAALIPIAPRAVFFGGVGLALAGVVATVVYVHNDPMEYDMKKLRNKETARAEDSARSAKAERITRYVGASGMAILVDRPEQVSALREELYKRRDAAPEDKKPFKAIYALQDFVPHDQAAKIPILLKIKDRVMRAQKRGLIPDADWNKLKDFLPPDDLKPFDIAELPVGMARMFTETDGTRGRIVYISPTRPELIDDAHYLLRWADSYRETKLPDGSVIRGSGRAVIYADMWAAVLDDVPPAVLFSFGATLLVVIVAFRAGRAALAVLGALLVGVAWMVGLLVWAKVKLNFLNFIALPITFGIGVDYAVNIVERYVREGAGGAQAAVSNTGGAVILCSMTTTLGYLALLSSMNEGVRSMGAAAVLGEVACLLAAVIVLPAGLLLLDRNLPKGARSTLSLHPPRPSGV